MPSAYIVTGTTRGIGKAMADEILRRGHRLFSISRASSGVSGAWSNYQCDLRDAEQVDRVMALLLEEIPYDQCADAILINNAGVLTPIGPLANTDTVALHAALQVNLLAPLHLTALFLRGSDRFVGHRRIINITSGAGWHPYAGWSHYCAAKAALNILTRCVALEQQSQEKTVGISAVAPGVVATDMQGAIGQTSASEFPERGRFIRLAASGGLLRPEQAARLILDLDASGQLQSGGLYDLRHVVWLDGKPTIAPEKENG